MYFQTNLHHQKKVKKFVRSQGHDSSLEGFLLLFLLFVFVSDAESGVGKELDVPPVGEPVCQVPQAGQVSSRCVAQTFHLATQLLAQAQHYSLKPLGEMNMNDIPLFSDPVHKLGQL